MLVSRISPAPRSTPSRAHSTASRPVGVRPPATYDLPAVVVRRAAWRRSPARRTARRTRSASSSISSGPRDRGGVDRDLVGAGVEHRLRVLDRADAAADRERDEHLVGGAARQLDDRVALLVRRGDVEEDELVGALGVVVRGQLDRVAGVADVDEVRALDDAAGVDVQAGDDALVVHSGASAPSSARLRLGDREAPLVERLADDHAVEVRPAAARRARAGRSSAPIPPE